MPLGITYSSTQACIRVSRLIVKRRKIMWIREEFLLSERMLKKMIVHGHTPGNRPVVKPNRICVDTGAYATDCLTAVLLAGEGCTFLSTHDTQTPR